MIEKTYQLGIDVSKYQGNVNWTRVRDEGGIKYVIHRIGYGKGNIDQKFAVNAEACRNLGIPSGGYWFSYAYNTEMARNEGRFAVEAMRKYFDRPFIAYDAEYDTINNARKHGIDIGKDLLTNMACQFLLEVTRLSCMPVLYTNRDYFNRMFNWEKIKGTVPDCRLWWATYTTGNLKASEQKIVDAWQYSSKGSVPGISGNVDMDRFYPSYFDTEDWGFKTSTPVETIPTENTNIENFQIAWNNDNPTAQVPIDGVENENTKVAKAAVNYMYNTTTHECSTGEVVKWIQRRLVEMGSHIPVDGKYGPRTKEAVIYYQKKWNLVPDGIAGKNTITSLFYN